MKKLFLLALLFLTGLLIWKTPTVINQYFITGAPPYDAQDGSVSESANFSWLRGWSRPDGPPKVALQVGHWLTDEVPEELERLQHNTGASGGGKSEWEVNFAIAQETKKLLEEKGMAVAILPTTIPPRYWADVFVAIHADGNLDPGKSGYKAATPRRDYTNKADKLLAAVETSYEDATGLPYDPNVTRNMRGYYAFSWWRYEHAIHPMTTSLILETGFLSSPSDRTIIVDQPELAAEGIANGIAAFLQEASLLPA